MHKSPRAPGAPPLFSSHPPMLANPQSPHARSANPTRLSPLSKIVYTFCMNTSPMIQNAVSPRPARQPPAFVRAKVAPVHGPHGSQFDKQGYERADRQSESKHAHMLVVDAMPARQSLDPIDTGPSVNVSGLISTFFPPNVRLTCGTASHGTAAPTARTHKQKASAPAQTE